MKKLFKGFLTVVLAALCQGNEETVGKSSKLIGGNSAYDHEYPHFAVVGQGYTNYRSRFIPTYFCGGSIIHKHWILTAAHCLERKAGSPKFMVSVGSNSQIFNDPAYAYKVKRVIRHRKYIKGFVSDYDIGLVKTDNPIKFSDTVKPIHLPKHEPIMSGSAMFAGFGRMQNSPYAIPHYMQEVRLDLYDREECQKHEYDYEVTERQLCTFNGRGQGTCYGDSGGGLIRDGEVIGIISHGMTENCAEGMPDVFTNVFPFVDWIRKATNNAV